MIAPPTRNLFFRGYTHFRLNLMILKIKSTRFGFYIRRNKKKLTGNNNTGYDPFNIGQKIFLPFQLDESIDSPSISEIEDTLLVNFNYTNTEKLYIGENKDKVAVIHIHGELDNPENPIIFGYGDEIDEKYKHIEQKNDNKYLENIKSIKYLETRNYQELLKFIDSGQYQIYIMGHSCGISDRTLLNTLFENKNCLSIKVFYHKKDDGSDNHSDLVRNISRNFKDKSLMRRIVVNKHDCEPLS